MPSVPSLPSFIRLRGALAGALLALVLPVASLHAQSTGTVAGSVSNAGTGKVLERAVVAVSGTNLSTQSLPDGTFRLYGVPAGEQTLQVSYTGLDDARASVTVTAGATVNVDVALKSDLVQLDTFRVSTEVEGNAYAVQQQKNAESQRTVISADAFGVISDANPGEFLKLMPGIQMDYTGIEPRGLMVRGMEPNLNLVMINGNQGANASSSSTNRVFEFDQITIDNIESIEVYKAPVPWLPANGVGGLVNMITRSAFLQKGRRINATVNLTANTDNLSLSRNSGPNDSPSRKIHPGGSFTYSDSFLNNRLGIVLSLSQVNVNGYGGTAYNTYTYLGAPAAPTPFPSNINGYVSQYQREDHQNFSTRSGASLNLDFKVSDNTTAYVRTTVTDHYYEFRNRFLRLNTGTLVGTPSPERVETTGANSEQNMSFGNKFNDSWTVNPGMKHRFDAWIIEYDGSVSRATNHYEYLPWMFGGVTLRNSGIGYILEKDAGRATATRITQTAGADIYTLGNGSYIPTANSINVGDRSSVDRIMAAKGKVRREFTARYPFWVEFGASVQEQERKRQNPSKQWSYAGPDGVVGTADDTTLANMQQFAEREYTPDLWFGERGPDAWISPFQLAKFYGQNPGAFVENVPNTYDVAFRNDQRVTETISAIYAAAHVKVSKLDVLAGLRIEKTEVEGEGAIRNDSWVPVGVNVNSLQGVMARLRRTSTANSYTPDPFKYLHLTYHFTDRLQTRLSYGEAIARPNFGSILPGNTINDVARTVAINNTALLPANAQNIDLSVEWYPSSNSVFTAAWFSKDISDYIVNNSYILAAADPELDLGNDLVGYTINTMSNLGRAKIEGIEISGRYRFNRLNGWLKGLELSGNFTKLYKTEGTFVAGSATTVYEELPTLAPSMWNVALNYTTPNGKLYFKWLANYVDDIPRNITGRPQEQSNERLVHDAEIRYNFSPRYTLSLAGRNVLEAEEGGSQFGRAIRTGTGGGSALTLTFGARF
jgi:iron complex outermembrane receptor protein